MSKIERYCRLNQDHDTVREVVRDIEHAWGEPAKVARIAELTGFAVTHVCHCLEELAEVGEIEWLARDEVASSGRGLPFLGDVS